MLLLEESEPFTDQSLTSSFSSENESQGGRPAGWPRPPPPSTSPSGEAPSHLGHGGQRGHGGHRPQPRSRSRSPLRLASQSPSPSASKRWSPKPAHMRRNIRKLLRDHQLEAGTKVAQQEELERKHRLETQRKQDSPEPLLPQCTSADASRHVKITATASQQEIACSRQEVLLLDSSDVRKYDSKSNGTGLTAAVHVRKAER